MHAWEQIQQSIDFIENHLNEEITIDNLAKVAALSPFYYQRLFHRLVKKPVAEYIKLRRMAKSTELLLKKDLRILDVALELGFATHEHFTRTFKDTFGITPVEYRKTPQTVNRMTKPQLRLNYAAQDEDVPLIIDNIILEVSRRQLMQPLHFAGLEKKMPVQFGQGLGVESGTDPLAALWNDFHRKKKGELSLGDDIEEIGVMYPCSDTGYYLYFAGAKTDMPACLNGFTGWELPQGEYVVCTFEAENFETLVTDVLYKAQQYLFGTWLAQRSLQTEPFCAERYDSYSPKTSVMDLWVKLVQ